MESTDVSRLAAGDEIDVDGIKGAWVVENEFLAGSVFESTGKAG